MNIIIVTLSIPVLWEENLSVVGDFPHRGSVMRKAFPCHDVCTCLSFFADSRDHNIDVIMTTMASQITSLTVVYSTVYSELDQRKHQSSASLAFLWGIHRDRWIPRTKGQLRGKCFHLMTSSWFWCSHNMSQYARPWKYASYPWGCKNILNMIYFSLDQ